jgi:hypothetical protein
MTTRSIPRAIAVRGIGVLAPGLDGWEAARSALAPGGQYVFAPMRNPVPSWMPAAERRRASLAIRLALEAAQQAVTHALGAIDAQMLAARMGDFSAVFTSCDGDGDTIHAVCLAVAQPDYPVSPTKFTNSVHNAAAGYWSIATGARYPSTSLCAWEGSFAAGLLEAVAQVITENRPVVLVASDAPLPPPLHALRPIANPFGCALVLAPMDAAPRLATLTVDLAPNSSHAAHGVPAELASNPSAHALGLLKALAQGPGLHVLRVPYLPDLSLACEVAV